MGGTAENESGLNPLFLFDENITGVGRAVRWVWRDRIRLVQDEPGLGRGADDLRDVIPWCAAHRATLFSFDRGFVQQTDYVQAVEQGGVRVVLVQQPRKPKTPRTHAEILWMVARALVLLDRGTEAPRFLHCNFRRRSAEAVRADGPPLARQPRETSAHAPT